MKPDQSYRRRTSIMKTTLDFSQATDFVWRTARLLDRHRFAFLFLDGPRDAVLAALRPYQNADGGFGHALEPDLRGPVSQPLPVWSALRVLDEINAFDDPMVKHACDYLMTITTSEGGVPFALPSIRSHRSIRPQVLPGCCTNIALTIPGSNVPPPIAGITLSLVRGGCQSETSASLSGHPKGMMCVQFSLSWTLCLTGTGLRRLWNAYVSTSLSRRL